MPRILQDFTFPTSFRLFLPKRPEADILRELLRGMLKKPLSVKRASMIIYHRQETMSLVRAEDIMDHLWDCGYCICLGGPGKYAYTLTVEGRKLL